MVQEERNRVNQGVKGEPKDRTQCQTCSRKHPKGWLCPGNKYQQFYDCGLSSHFQGAPLSKKSKDKKKKDKQNTLANSKDDKQGQLKRVQETSSDEVLEDSDGTTTDATCRIKEFISKTRRPATLEARVIIKIRSQEGGGYLDVAGSQILESIGRL